MKHDADSTLTDLNSINQKIYPRDKPKPTLETYGQKYFMNKGTILFALKFLKKAQGEPSDSMWDELPRKIMLGRDMGITKPQDMKRHLQMSGIKIPDWLEEEFEKGNNISKGDVCVWIYKAMIENLLKELESRK